MKKNLITSLSTVAILLSVAPAYADQKQDFINTAISENLNYYQEGVGIDSSSALPYDHITYDGKNITEIGKFDNPTTIGFYLNAMVLISKGDIKNKAISSSQALIRIKDALTTLQKLQANSTQTWEGLFYWYSLEGNKISPKDGVISAVDNANLAFSLAGVIGAYLNDNGRDAKAISTMAKAIITNQAQGWYKLYDPNGEDGKGMMYAGYDTAQDAPLGYHVDRVLNESRLVPVWAILTNSMRSAKEQVPVSAFSNMQRASVDYVLSNGDKIKDITMTWDGTVFQELLPEILVNENTISPFMRANHKKLVTVQADFAKTLNIPALLSASSTANAGHDATENGQNDYASFGVPAVSESYTMFSNPAPQHYTGTPHASALTYLVNTDTAYSLLSNLKTNHAEIVSDYGWYDAIGSYLGGDTQHSLTILGLDQGMFVLALAGDKTSSFVEGYLKSVGQYDQLKAIYATLDDNKVK